MKFWLIKTEPEEWSWEEQISCDKKGSVWDGVRNFQARNNLKSMKLNDQCFFYHTGKEKRIVGIVKVIKEFFRTSVLSPERDKLHPALFIIGRGKL